MTRYDDQNRRLCTKTTRAGNPCRAPALKGHLVCNKHGGSLPNVKAKSARNLLEGLVEPALMALDEIVQDAKQPASARVAAARDILDRTGYKPVVRVEGVPSLAAVEAWIGEAEAENE